MKQLNFDLLRLAVIESFDKATWYIIIKRYKELEKQSDEEAHVD